MQFSAIQERCANMLLQCLSHENVLQIYALAELTGSSELARKAFGYILYTFDTLGDSKDKLSELSLEILTKILGHNNLNCKSEMDVLEIVNHWIAHQDETVTEDETIRLISCARFHKFDAALLKTVSNMTMIQNSHLLSKVVASLATKLENPNDELKACKCYCHDSTAASLRVSSCQRCRYGTQSTNEKDSDSTQELLEHEPSCCAKASGCLFPYKGMLRKKPADPTVPYDRSTSSDVCHPPEILRLCDMLLNAAPRTPPFAACVVAHVRSRDTLTGLS